MITRPSSRPQSLLRAVAKQAQSPPSSLPRPFIQRRYKHALPMWGNQARQQFYARHGVPGFLSAETYNETYVQYSEKLAEELNAMTLGTVDEDLTTHELHQKYAHRSDKAHIYNISAMLTFTRYFWESSMTESEDPAVRKPGLTTMQSIQATFGDVETLREEILETADAMFGNGFVWLMKGKNRDDLKILATYNAGSPHPAAAPRRDDRDMATFTRNQTDVLIGRSSAPYERDIAYGNTTAGFMGDSSSQGNKYHLGRLEMEPILCVNVWEHQWLRDYGLLGKRRYLAAWWDRIDWQKVEASNALREVGRQYISHQEPYASSGGRSVLDVWRG